MTYRVYIKEDYKNKVERIEVRKKSSPFIKLVLASFTVVAISSAFIFGTDSPVPEKTATITKPVATYIPPKPVEEPVVNTFQIPDTVEDPLIEETEEIETQTIAETIPDSIDTEIYEEPEVEPSYVDIANESEIITLQEDNVDEIEAQTN